MTVAEFYEFVDAHRDARWEFVDGEPAALAPANRRHDQIVVAALRLIGNHLEWFGCLPFTSRTYIAIPGTDRLRMGDFGIDAGRLVDDSLQAAEPVLIAEVCGVADDPFYLLDKIEDYQAVESLRYILLIDADQPRCRLWLRDAARRWASVRLSGLDAVIDLSEFDLRLPLSGLYVGLEFNRMPTPCHADIPTS